MFYTSAWSLRGEERFKENIPLLALGDSLLRFHSKERIKVLLLEGFKDLSQSYIAELSERNIDVINFDEEFASIIKKYPNLDIFYSHYERNCFLRWIAFGDYREINDAGQFWHLDGDMAFYISLDEFAKRTKGLTFMTLGSPCFLTVSQSQWFEIYESELRKLDNNIQEYLKNSGITKKECKSHDREKFNTSLYREPLGSDQDFLEYLISSGKIPQDDYRKIIESGFYYSSNPLSFLQMERYLSDKSNAPVLNDNAGHLIYKGLQIPFLHYQSGFYYFAVVASFIPLPRFFLKSLVIYDKDGDTTDSSVFGKYLWKMFREINPGRFSRNNMVTTMSTLNKRGVIKIVKLLNNVINSIC